MKKFIYAFLIFICIIQGISADRVLRDDITGAAFNYTIVSIWSPNKDTIHIKYIGDTISYIWESPYKIGKSYFKMPYVFGGFDSEDIFWPFITGTDPAYPAGGYNTEKIYLYGEGYQYNTDSKIGGIDCAGFIHRIWKISNYTSYKWLTDSTVLIVDSFKRRGDLANIPGHQMLYISGDTSAPNVYESTSKVNDGYPGVQFTAKRILESCKIYTPFPYIFPSYPHRYECVDYQKKPIEVACSLKSMGSIGNIKMTINGTWIEHTANSDALNRNIEIKYKVRHPEKGIYKVKVYAENTLFNNQYCDTFAYEFYHGLEFDAFRVSYANLMPIPEKGYIFLDSTFFYDYNAGDSIFLSGNPLGTSEHWVDDIIIITATDTCGAIKTWKHNYSSYFGAVTPEPPTNITGVFFEGKNLLHIQLLDDENFRVDCGCSDLWISRNKVEYAKIVNEDVQAEEQITKNQIQLELVQAEDCITFLSNNNTSGKELAVFDVLGREIFSTEFTSDKVVWNKCSGKGERVSRGVYFYRIRSGNENITGKITILH